MDDQRFCLPEERGELWHSSQIFGHSRLGNRLEVYLPEAIIKDVGLIIAGQHGDEADGTHLLSRALRLLPKASLKCAAVLSANPDGVLRSTRGNTAGVDLNRNFPTRCWKDCTVKHKWSPAGSQDVHLNTGEMAGSEPETQALISLIGELKPSWIISIHSPLACIDDAGESELGVWMSEHMQLPLVNTIGYETPGSFGQWCKEHAQPLVTLELHDSLYHMDQQKVMEALLILLQGHYPN